MRKVLQERGFGNLPSSTERNSRDQFKSISTTIEADSNSIRRIGSNQYAVSTGQNSKLVYRSRQTKVPFPSRLDINYCEEEGNYGPKFMEWSFAYQQHHTPKGASVSVMPLSTYLNLGLGELAHTRLTVEFVKYPKGIAENVLVGIGKFTFPIDFKILDMPEDIKVPLILKRPFLSTARAKIDVYKRKITLKVGQERSDIDIPVVFFFDIALSASGISTDISVLIIKVGGVTIMYQARFIIQSYDLKELRLWPCEDWTVTTRRNSDDDVPNFEAMITAAVANALPNLTAALRTQITNDIRNGVGSSGGGGGDNAIPHGIHVWIERFTKLKPLASVSPLLPRQKTDLRIGEVFQVLGCPNNFKTRHAALNKRVITDWWKASLCELQVGGDAPRYEPTWLEMPRGKLDISMWAKEVGFEIRSLILINEVAQCRLPPVTSSHYTQKREIPNKLDREGSGYDSKRQNFQRSMISRFAWYEWGNELPGQGNYKPRQHRGQSTQDFNQGQCLRFCRGDVYLLATQQKVKDCPQGTEAELCQADIARLLLLQGAPVLLFKRRMGLRLCIDYRELNRSIDLNPILSRNSQRLFDQLQGAKIFFQKIDRDLVITSFRVREQDISKTAFPMTSSFTFQVYRRAWNKNLRIVCVEILRQKKLYAKFLKCEFWLQQVAFLGHIVSADGIIMDPSKVEAITKWPRPTSGDECGLKDKLCIPNEQALPRRYYGRLKVLLYYSSRFNQDVQRFETVLLVERHEARCGYVCIQMYDLSAGQNKHQRQCLLQPEIYVKRDEISMDLCYWFGLYSEKTLCDLVVEIDRLAWCTIRPFYCVRWNPNQERTIKLIEDMIGLVGFGKENGPELIEITNEKVVVAKEKLKEARSRQKSYADKHRRDLEFQVGDRVFLKVSPFRGVKRFGIKGKLSPRFQSIR
ncbi:putative reverse transcriptase domain-containing protein [Tanacetum coccineum]